MRARITVVAALGWAALAPAASAANRVLELDAGAGARVVVEDAPFRIVLLDRDGRELVATIDDGIPVRPPGVDGPEPIEPVGAAGGYPALGWVAGSRFADAGERRSTSGARRGGESWSGSPPAGSACRHGSTGPACGAGAERRRVRAAGVSASHRCPQMR